MFCTDCGKEVEPGNVFCPYCGSPMKEEGGKETPPGAPMEPRAAGSPVPPAKPAATSRKKWVLPVVIAAAALVVCAVIVIVLVFTVFKEPSGPAAAVEKMYKAMTENDVNAIMDLVDPEPFEKDPKAKDSFESYIKKNIPPKGTAFEGLTYKTTINASEATVTLTGGKVRSKDKEGKVETTEIVKMTDDPNAYLVSRNGNWYFAKKNFIDFWSTRDLAEADGAMAEMGSEIKEFGQEAQAALATATEGATDFQQLEAQFKEKSSAVIAAIDASVKKIEEAKKAYEVVYDSKDAGKDYRRYAELRLSEVDAASKVLDLLKQFLNEIGGFLSGLAANPPSNAEAVTQGLTDIQNKYVAQLDSWGQRVDSVDEEAEELREELGLD